MKYRQFGKTGIKVSEIGFGAWGIGGTQSDSRAYGLRMIRFPEMPLEKLLMSESRSMTHLHYMDTVIVKS